MNLVEGVRVIRRWPRRRFGVGLAVAVVFVAALAGLSGLAPFGDTVGAGWRYPMLLLLGALIGLYGATAVQAPIGAEMTLCDLRWPALAAIGTVYAGRDATLSTGIAVLFPVAAVTVMLWAVLQRLEREHEALRSGDGEVCVTCRPLFTRRPAAVAPASLSAMAPIPPAPVQLDGLPQEPGDQPPPCPA